MCCVWLLQEATYEDSPGALLGGAVISGLLLSANDRLSTLGFKLAFEINRLALAATYTSSFTTCRAQLSFFLRTFPGDFSGPIGTPPMQARGAETISEDAQRVLCASIAAVSGPTDWDENSLWQGTADVVNAIFKTIYYGRQATPPVAISPTQITGLCAVTKAVYSFASNMPASAGIVSVTVPAQLLPGEKDDSCYTTVGPCNSPGGTFEGLAPGHTLDANSFAGNVCGW